MQASAVLLFAICLQVSAATYSQTVSFTGKDVPLKTVFASVKKQTGFGFFYENGEEGTLKGAGNVTLDLKNVALDLFLQVCLRNQPLEYSVEGTTVFIKKKEARSAVTVELSDSARIPEIKGRVTNEKGEPLVNANVVVKRTGRGTVTDANGRFTLHNVGSEDVISVTFIGYKAQVVPVRDRTSFTLVMEPATNELDKMVVQAYGTTSQRLATGNIGVVRAEDIAKQPVMNVMDALQGQVAGTVVTQTSAYASGAVKVEIRGRNTIDPNFPSDPLYIIDGVPLTIIDASSGSSYNSGSQGFIVSGIASPANGQSPFFSLNPADIESIEVLKDADATAIYGSRGSNGVILISTKKGKAGKIHLDLSMYQGIDKVTTHYPLLNTRQYISMRKEALTNDGLPIDINSAPDLISWDTTHYIDWQKYFWGRTGNTTDVQASLSGGDIRTDFRVSGSFHQQRDLTAASGNNQRTSLSFSLNNKSINERFRLSLSGTYSYNFSNLIALSGDASIPPIAPPPFNKLGNINFNPWTAGGSFNPFGNLLQPYTFSTNFLNADLLLSYEIIKSLTLKTNLGYNNAQTKQTQIFPIISQDPQSNPSGSMLLGNNFVNNLIIEPQLEYNTFISKGKLNILVGGSSQLNNTSSLNNTGHGYINDALLTSISNAPIKDILDYSGEYKYASVFGRINYNWNSKYILNINGRRDGSSRFGPGKQYGNFGSVGIAWLFSEENWLKKHLSFLSFGKIRGSYGIVGGDQVSDYAFLTQWIFGNNTYNGGLPLIPQKHTDSLLHWQVNRKLELALSLGLLKDRITFEASWYRNRCDNQLVGFSTPEFTGFPSVTSNSPANVQNTGLEFIASSKIIDSKGFKWSARFNIGINRNKLLSYPNISQSPYANTLIVGKSLNISKYLHYTGVDPQTGLYNFLDKHKDGIISKNPGPLDDRFAYDLSTKFDGGLTTTFTVNNWELSLFFYFRNQVGQNAFYSLGIAGGANNIPLEVFKNHWQKPGDIVPYGKLTSSPSDVSFYLFQSYSDALITDASFIRLQNLSLSYTLPSKFLAIEKISNCKIFLRGQNLFVITKYKGTDPEIRNFSSMPLPRTLTGGISINF